MGRFTVGDYIFWLPYEILTIGYANNRKYVIALPSDLLISPVIPIVSAIRSASN